MPRLPKKSPCDDDPFWDNWDEEPIAKENRAPLRRTKTKKKKMTTNAAASRDPFGRDGFGDGWNYKPVAKFDCDDHDPVPQEAFSSAEFDWGPSALRARACRQAEEAKRKKEREEWLERGVKKVREAKAKAKVEAEAKAAQAKAEAEAKAKAMAAQAKIAAEEEWRFKVKQATDCIAHADPVQALTILHSLSLENEDLLDCIEEVKKKEVGQLYTAIFDRQELLKSLLATFEDCSSSYLDDRPASSEIDESTSNESTIGSNTVEEYHKDGEETLLVDRLPTRHGNETNESRSVDATVGGDTVKVNPSNTETGDSNTETGSQTVVVDRHKSIGGSAARCHDGDNNNKSNNSNNTMKQTCDEAARSENCTMTGTYYSKG